MGCEDCVNRRRFLAQAGMAAAVAAVAAACGNGQIGPAAFTAPGGGGGSTNKGIKVGDYPGLATVGTLVQVTNYQAVKRTGATTFVAYSMVCTHQGCLTQLSSNRFYCPCHGAQFDSNGRVTRGPASRSLPQYTTTYDPTTDLLTIG